MRELAGLTLMFAALVTAPVGYVWPVWWAAAAIGTIVGGIVLFRGRRAGREHD